MGEDGEYTLGHHSGSMSLPWPQVDSLCHNEIGYLPRNPWGEKEFIKHVHATHSVTSVLKGRCEKNRNVANNIVTLICCRTC